MRHQQGAGGDKLDGGNGFGAQSSARVHVGLGGAPRIDSLEVRWPSGARQTFTALPADRIFRLIEGEASPRPFVATRSGR